MKIGLTGTMSCGKTTLINALAELPQFQGYKIATERSKYLRDLGIPLNTDSTLKGQTIFLAERVSELMHENLITDRTVIDVMAFTKAAKSIEYYDAEAFCDAASKLVGEYDYVFYVSPEGVVYKPAQLMWEYFCGRKPEVHIAWRHNIKLTDAPTYLWCHDLTTPGAEKHDVYEKIICLSNFHKNYVQVQQGIPDSKIVVSRNGVNVSRFETKKTKIPTKIVWPSSADRGLDRAIDIVEKARLRSGVDFELHVYYGMENMKKYPGPYQQMAIDLEKKMSERPWVKYHGNVEQKHLAQEMLEASMWLYPANFIETYCITVLEAVCAGVYPIVREIGALKDTVRPFYDKDMADLVFLDAANDEEKNAWADLVIDCYNLKKWEKVSMNGFDYSWEGVADQFMDFMKVKEETISSEFEGVMRDVTVYTPNGEVGLQDIGV